MNRFLTAAALSAALTACSTATESAEEQEQASYEPPTTLAEATEGPSDVAVFETGDEDTTVYLMGTVHLLRPGVDWKTDAYEEAFAAADAIFVEADVSPEATAELAPFLAAQTQNPEGVTLSSYFSEEERAKLDAALAEIGVPLSALDGLRPWAASLNLALIAFQKMGADPNSGVERLIEADAAAAGKPVRTFETARQQFEMITGVPDEAWAAAMIADIDETIDPEAYFASLVGAWYDGRMDVVGQIMNDGLTAAPALAEAMLYERNANWAEQLASLIETETGTFLVAVGAGHLGGEKSLQDYLEAEGYTVELAE